MTDSGDGPEDTKKRTRKPKKNPHAKALGELGAAKGGKARAEALTPERRSEIAQKAAAARWQPLLATHRGNFKEEFGIDVECYVLNDEQKTAVISKRGMGAAMGLAGQIGGAQFRYFLSGKKIAPYVGSELTEKLDNPLVFQWLSAGSKGLPPATVHGYDVTILIDICKTILEAESGGALGPRHRHIVKQAQIIVAASAKAGIKGLVYALAGYDATRAEIIAAYKLYVREEAREYEKEFPDQLYAEWYRLYRLPKPERNKPWKFKDLTIDQVYIPLAHSHGKILSLVRAQKAAGEARHKKLHQFLSEIGVKALRMHLGTLTGIAQVSDDLDAYERNFARVFGGQQMLPPPPPSGP